MKIVEKFTDLDKSNAYVAELNAAFQKEVSEKMAEQQKSVTLQASLDAELLENTKRGELIHDLQVDNTKLTADLQLSQEQLVEALDEVGTLSAKLDLQEKYGKDGMVVMVHGKNYMLDGDSFIYDGQIKTATELSKDQEQLEKMVAKGSGALVELK